MGEGLDHADRGADALTEKSGRQTGWGAIAAANAVSFLVIAVCAARGLQFPPWILTLTFVSVSITQAALAIRWLCDGQD